MTRTYIALLRGINVGGHRLIKMADLKAMFVAQGFGGAQTYIQSGNVVFRADEAEEPLRERIERQIAATFGFPVVVALRTHNELARIITACPFAPDALAEGERLYVALLAETPTPTGIERMLASKIEPDEFRVVGREVYLLYRQNMRATQLTNNLLESRLGVPATSRNWRTVTTLAAMSKTLAGE
ncbi:MAG TPA: DUF1697 domain-containing protein [Ktedonobacterales bacterium]|nr:DUF1697 domain-containing protein [Ktedonobacterales bacterium]